MTFLIVPALVFGLLSSSSPEMGACLNGVQAEHACESCGMESGSGDALDRRARRHTAYYRFLIGDCQAGSKMAGVHCPGTQAGRVGEIENAQIQD